MDCTGCERKLYRSLAALPELSNIKTSLLLAHAEFDMFSSVSIHRDNIISIMEKMTGFTCTRSIHSGAKLELIVEGSGNFLDSWPTGVKVISPSGKHSIQVSYNPRIVGARDLLSDPFFQQARLAPCSVSLVIASGRAHLLRTIYFTLLSAILTIPVLVLAWGPFRDHEVRYGAASLTLATVVQIVIAGPFYIKAFNSLVFARMIDMDLLIVLSSSAAYIYSVFAYAYQAIGRPLATESFFETSTLLVTLIMVGRTVSEFARQKAIESITIESLQTPNAILVDEMSQTEENIDARLLQYEDTFKVLPDMSIVTDGVVVSGESEVDESLITGEATLIAKRPGMSVVAGSVNHSGFLLVKLTRLPSENTIKEIGAMVDEAKLSKPKVQELADRVASFFVPAILAVTALVFVIWIIIGETVRHQKPSTSAINAMTFAISVLIVSCPCAIGLAVPMVIIIAGGVAARHGLIFKTAETIDIGRKVAHVVFDKTGTLTQGKLHIVTEEYLDNEHGTHASLILSLTTNSKHPVSKALASHLSTRNIQPSNIEKIVSIPGNGIEASYNDSVLRAGNPYWLNMQDHPSVQRLLTKGLTIFCATLNDNPIAIFGLEDLLRPDALQTITELKKRSIAISIISGDNETAVQSIATKLFIPSSNIRSRCSPDQKQAYVKSLLASPTLKRANKTILFIGDGTNDAPSLASASIGLHIGDGSEIASLAADAVLIRPSLSGILTLIDLSKAFHRRVVFNFVWSGVYNLVAVLLAAGVFEGVRGGKGGERGGVRIPPQYAGLGEVVSVLPVVGAAVGLRFWRG
jgi:Cu2+-exporting ATPase